MHARWRKRLRLGFAGLLATLGVSAYLLDAQWKQWPSPGFALEGDVLVASADLPAVWRGVLASEGGDAVAKALSRSRGAAELAVRQATGIRPTPIRWSAWLGDRLVVSRSGAQWLGCFRPGVLLHAALPALRAMGTLTLLDGAEHFGDLVIRWQDGFLLVSNAPLSVLSPGPELPPPSTEAPWGYLWLRSQDDATQHPLLLALAGTEGLPLEISWDLVTTPPASALGSNPTPSDPAPAMLEVIARSGDAWENLPLWALVAHLAGLPRESVVSAISLQPNLPGDFPYPMPDPALPSRRVLFDLACSEGVLLKHIGSSVYQPEGAWASHPLAALALDPPLQTVPFAWGNTEGLLVPVLGEDFTFGCVLQGAWAHTANLPASIPRLLLKAPGDAGSGPALRVAIDWKQLAPAIKRYLQQRLQLGLLPGDPRAFEVEYAPWTNALEALGRSAFSSVDDAATPTRMRLRGQLAVANAPGVAP